MKDPIRSTEPKSKQARLRQKLKSLGFVQVAVWCLPQTAEKIKKLAARDRVAAGVGASGTESTN